MTNATESLCADAGEEILADLRGRIGPQRYNAWFRKGVRISVEGTHVSVAVPNPFVANWIDSHYRSTIAEVVRARTGRELPVAVSVDATLGGQVRRAQLDGQAKLVERAAGGRTRPRSPGRDAVLRYSLDDFVVGESNRLAYTAATAMVSRAGAPFNPLFIYGPCG
ncbi:MAG: hypothetical protein J7M21_01920, partial [Planctomycetes bacterium]|nr:hypothetical protein [Planctomycetota bacterium]